ncbi:MAG: DUF1573 domain-containing protein [Bacteroidota bacterium]
MIRLFAVFFLCALVGAGCEQAPSQKNPTSVGGVKRDYSKVKQKSNPTPPPPQPQPKGFVPVPGQSTAIHFAHFAATFGPVPSGDTVVAVYPFKNMSERTVRIAQAATSCECLATEYPEGNIQPGQEGEVRASFYTDGQWGTHEKIIAVQLEGETDAITLRLNGRVEKVIP